MLLGTAPFASSPLGTGLLNTAIEAPFYALLRDVEARRVFLINTSLGGADVYLGSGESFSSGEFYRPGLVSALDYRQTVFRDVVGDVVASLGVGDVTFASTREVGVAADLDDLCSPRWDGNSITILLGGEDFLLSEFNPIMTGTIKDATWNEKEFAFVIRDQAAKLDLPVQPNTYAGTGSLEGGDDLKNRPKPLCYGAPKNVEPILVDRPNQVYQVHDGVMDGFDAIYDSLAPYTSAGDVSNVYSWTPVEGQFVTNNTGGYFRLGSLPSGLVTCDPRGDSGGPLGYVVRAADIIRRVLTKDTDWSDSDLDLVSFAKVNNLRMGTCGIFVSTSSTTRRTVINDLLSPLGFRFFSAKGKLAIGILDPLSTPVRTITEDEIVAGSLRRERTQIPPWQIKLGFAKNYSVANESQIAGVAGASDAIKDFATQEFRFVEDSSTGVQTNHPLSEMMELFSTLSNQTDAETELSRAMTLLAKDLHRYNLTTAANTHSHQIQVGQRVRLKHSRFGLANGIDLFVLETHEHSKDGTTDLSLWG